MKAIAVALLALGGLANYLTGCGTTGPPPNQVLGDSDAQIVAVALGMPTNTITEGTCGLDLPPANKVLIHAGGHSTIDYPNGYYDEPTWRNCLLATIDHYGASHVWVATAPSPLAIYCQWGTDEYSARLLRATQWKLDALPTLRPGVHIVRWDDIGTGPDCTHFTIQGAYTAASRAQQAGF